MSIINKIQNLPWNKRNVNQITQIVVHHSAYRHNDQNNQSRFETLRGFHTNQGWYGLSYHYVIFKNGEIWQCNNLTDASPTDGINYPSLGILVDGYFHDRKDKPTIEQLRSLDWLLADLCNNHPEFPAVRTDVKGHREVNSTACPGDDLIIYVIEWRDTGKLAILEGNQEQPTPTPTQNLGDKLIDSINQNEIFDASTREHLINAVHNQDGGYIIAFSGAEPRKEIAKLQEQNAGLARQNTDNSSEKVRLLEARSNAENLTQKKDNLIHELEIKLNHQVEINNELKTLNKTQSEKLDSLTTIVSDKQKIVEKQGEILNSQPKVWNWTEFIIGQLKNGVIPSLAGLSGFVIALLSSPEFLELLQSSKGLALFVPIIPMIIAYLKELTITK